MCGKSERSLSKPYNCFTHKSIGFCLLLQGDWGTDDTYESIWCSRVMLYREKNNWTHTHRTNVRVFSSRECIYCIFCILPCYKGASLSCLRLISVQILFVNLRYAWLQVSMANSNNCVFNVAALCMDTQVLVHRAAFDVTFPSLNSEENRNFWGWRSRKAARKIDFLLMSFDTNNARSVQIKSIWSLEIVYN